MPRTVLVYVVLCFPCAAVLQAQSAAETCALPGAAAALRGNGEYARVLALLRGTRPAVSFVQRASALTGAPCYRRALGRWSNVYVNLAAATSLTTWNSVYPLDRNNGALWSGKGFASAFSGGAELRMGRFELALLPILTYQENRSFPTAAVGVPGYSTLINAGHPQAIDWPQRFGFDPFTGLEAGQSYARVRAGPWTIGLTNETIWLGPALRNPILLSNSGPGFPQFYVNLHALRTPVGMLAGDLFWGRLDESEFFDDDADNDLRLMQGLALSYEPRWTPGLSLGAARLYTSIMQDRGALELIGRAYGFSDSDTRSIEDNVLFALFARYAMPAARAEVFAEWAHEEGFAGLRDLLREPDQSQAYTLGFQKLIQGACCLLRVYGELTHLEAAPPLRAGRGVLTFYTHGAIAQGHTHRGQLLGAWIGPGSDAQTLGLDLFDDRFSAGLYVERVRFDADAYYNQWARYYGHNGHDAQLALGLRGVLRWRVFEGSIDGHLARRYNRSFRTLDGAQPGRFTRETNVNLDLQLTWLPGLAR
jgi:hypothetical protein